MPVKWQSFGWLRHLGAADDLDRVEVGDERERLQERLDAPEPLGDRDGCGPGEIRMGKRKVLMFGSNDYLDLINHPKVKEAASQALRKYGTGCSGSRLLNGRSRSATVSRSGGWR